ncbi:MAG TPA: class II aldolase/adducin family protein [Candidatus Methylacidiphilales bacterium]
MTSPRIFELLDLSRELGKEERGLAILGEGNTSARTGPETFAVKASGRNLATLDEKGLSECRFDAILPLFDEQGLTDAAIDERLLAARTRPDFHGKPSVEALFHAYFLTLPGVEFVGHAHATTVNALLCSPRAREFAANRLFPDEIVCCGPASVYIPYVDPGLPLAVAIREETRKYIDKHGAFPRVVLLENHGIVTLGGTSKAVLAAMLMAEKAARIFVGAAALGGPVFLTPEQIVRIGGRPDEHYRQKALGMK